MNPNEKEENNDKEQNIKNKEKNKETEEKDAHMQYIEKILLHDKKRIIEIINAAILNGIHLLISESFNTWLEKS